MRLAHVAIVTPHRAGLYETVRDLVDAERKAGVDARIIDPQARGSDRGVPCGYQFSPHEFDCIINHSGLGAFDSLITKSGVPVIHCMHGRPESSFRLESNGKVGVYSFLRSIATDEKYKRFVTFWPQFAPYWKVILPADKVIALTPPVDLQSWNPDGPRGYQFHEKRGTTNIVIADMWRDDITPFHVVHAAAIYCQKHNGAKLHLYGLHRTKALDVLLAALESLGVLGEAVGMVDGLANVYRAADMLVSPHAIATRAIREAMACGCPVVAPLFGASHEIEVMATNVESVWTREETRKYAEQNYDSRITAKEMIALVEEVLA